MGTQAYPCVAVVKTSENAAQDSTRSTFMDIFMTAIPLVALAVSTVAFNLMVLLMFKVKRSLRSCKNIYLGSLALADLIIGLCMFLALVQQLNGHGEWLSTFGCRFYLVLRQSALYVSLLSLVLITGDRWWSVQYPFSYRARRRTKNALVAVVLVWLFGFILHIPPVVLWDFIVSPVTDAPGNSSSSGYELPQEQASTCELPFSNSILFVSVASGVQYFIPLVAMLILNCSLYVGILRRKRVQIRRSVSSRDKLFHCDRRTSISSFADSGAEENLQLLKGFEKRSNSFFMNANRRNSADVVLLRSSFSTPQFSSLIIPPANTMRRFSWAPRKSSVTANKGGEELARSLLVRQDRKAALWLALLVIVFLVCWLPHTIVGILQSAKRSSVPQWAKDLTFWFLLANSAINPLLYGLFNKEMRRAFKQWLCGNTSNRRYRAKHALLFYGVSLNSAMSVPKNIVSFDAVPE